MCCVMFCPKTSLPQGLRKSVATRTLPQRHIAVHTQNRDFDAHEVPRLGESRCRRPRFYPATDPLGPRSPSRSEPSASAESSNDRLSGTGEPDLEFHPKMFEHRPRMSRVMNKNPSRNCHGKSEVIIARIKRVAVVAKDSSLLQQTIDELLRCQDTLSRQSHSAYGPSCQA